MTQVIKKTKKLWFLRFHDGHTMDILKTEYGHNSAKNDSFWLLRGDIHGPNSWQPQSRVSLTEYK